MEVLMSFYEDRKEDKEEDGEFMKNKSWMCFVLEYKVFLPLLFLSIHASFYIIRLDLLYAT
jgi:hypothetical protein